MRSAFKAVVTTAVLVPVLFAGAGVAAAGEGPDSGPAYKQKTNSATAAGGATSAVKSGFWGDTAYFLTKNAVATPAGATGTVVGSRS
ncbi:hypothetical protein [Streptomyces sp. NPDC060194]|uniref:hypothetical protein n=1 Tax=Streptomyces sp. NPDC060194 TaxID=3347069 RepID=UPI003666BA65